MKVLLICVACFVGLSVEQDMFHSWTSPLTRLQYAADFESNVDSLENDADVTAYYQDKTALVNDEQAFYPLASQLQDTRSRTNGRVDPYSNQLLNYLALQSRFIESRLKQARQTSTPTIVPLVNPTRFFNLLYGFTQSTTTTFLFIPSAMTTTITNYCTESAAFKVLTTCSIDRKRRQLGIEASSVEKISMSSAVALPRRLEDAQSGGEIISSMLEEEVYASPSRRLRTFGATTPLVMQSSSSSNTLLVTSTITTLHPVPETVQTTLTVKSSNILAVGVQLLCIPPGAVMCSADTIF